VCPLIFTFSNFGSLTETTQPDFRWVHFFNQKNVFRLDIQMADVKVM